MAAPGSFTAGSVLTAAEMNDLPAGIVYLDQTASSPDPIIGTTTVVIRTTSIVLETGRRYKISATAYTYLLSTTLTVVTRIMDGATRLALQQWTGNATFNNFTFSFFAIVDGDGSSHTVSLDTVASTGSFTFSTASNRPAVLLIEDIGPS